MEWKYVKPLKSVELINEFESMAKYVFCDSFKDCVVTNNGGRPSKRVFDTDKSAERELKTFLSFNKEDRETIWKIFDWNKEELSNKYIPFAIDVFGNMICFNTCNDKVVFVNHEDLSVEIVAGDFSSFLSMLYDI